MTKRAFEELVKDACVLYINELPEEKSDMEVKFSKKHEKQMKDLFERINNK